VKHIKRVSRTLIAAFILGTCAMTAGAAGIVPDGNTATTVSAAANGRPTVNLATAVGGVSNWTTPAPLDIPGL